MFSPALIDASLAMLAPDDLTEDAVRRVAAVLSRPESQYVRLFGHLPPVQVERGRRWVDQAVAASTAVRYLAGDPRHHLPVVVQERGGPQADGRVGPVGRAAVAAGG